MLNRKISRTKKNHINRFTTRVCLYFDAHNINCMIKPFTLLLALVSFCTTLQAQQNKSTPINKIFYAELGGPGVAFAANYDQRFDKNSRFGWGFRIGAGFTLVDREEFSTITLPGGGTSVSYSYRTRSIATIPVGVNYVFGKPNNPNMFEVGAGATFLSRKASILNYDTYKERSIMGFATFMYRRQPIDGGVTWRIGFTPMLNTEGNVFPLFGSIGLGYAFK